ncbi:MAG: SixA phosphatase family protein [Pseudonocardia sp.]
MPGAQRTLVVLRHAKSAWPQAVGDEQRPLAARGRRDAPAAGRWLRDNVGEITTVLCSPAVRAVQTWELVSEELDVRAEAQIDERLYGASAAELLTIIRALPDTAASVLLIGHNPGVEDLVSVLTGTPQLLKTSAITVLPVSGRWTDLGPHTVAEPTLMTPRG